MINVWKREAWLVWKEHLITQQLSCQIHIQPLFFFFNLISCSLPSFSWKYPLAVSVLWHMMSCSWSSLIPAVTWLGFFLDFLEFLSWLMHLKLTFYTDDREEDVCSKDLRTCWIENSWLQNGKSESRLKMLAIAFEDTISAIQRRITCSV